MSKVFGKTEEIIKTTVRVLDGIRCDKCGKVISANLINTNRKAARYFKVTTGHNDWGLESPESINHVDICPECINEFVKSYLEKGSDTAYIEIETDLCYAMKVRT